MKTKFAVLFLLVALLVGAFSLPASAIESGDEVKVYNGDYAMAYLVVNGAVRSQKYVYFLGERSGSPIEVPAYCVSPTTQGVWQVVNPGQYVRYQATDVNTDPKIFGIMANSYPHKELSQLGLDNIHQAYYASKMALWCYINPGWDINSLRANPNLSGNELAIANKILAATRLIYNRGMMENEVLIPSLRVTSDTVSAATVLIGGQEYYEQTFTVHSQTWVKDLKVNVAFSNPGSVPANSRIVNLSNQTITQVTIDDHTNGYSGKFKVLVPKTSVSSNTTLSLSLSGIFWNYDVYRGISLETAVYGQLQDYLFDTDPEYLSSGFGSMQIDTSSPPGGGGDPDDPDTGLTIYKYEKGTTTPLEGAIFEVKGPSGNVIGSFATDYAGKITIPVTESGNYTVTETSPPQHYLPAETPTQSVTVIYGQVATVTFENEPYGNLRIEKKDAATGYSLMGAEIRITHIESGETYTQTTSSGGSVNFAQLRPGAYLIEELTPPPGYTASGQSYTVNVVKGTSTTYTLLNDAKPGLRIVKHDAQTMERLAGVSFEIYRNSSLLGTYTTDELGEIVLYDIQPGTYYVVEVGGPSSHVVDSTPQQIEVEAGGGIYTLVFFNYTKPGMSLIKVDLQTMEPLPNAVFRISQVGGSFSKEFTTGLDGTIDLSELEPGAYLVEEVSAPEGYEICNYQRIIQLNPGENAFFVFTDIKKPAFELVKYDPNTGEYLAGASFRIAKIEDGTHYLDRITDENGRIYIEGLEPGVYSVKEVSAPGGYVLNETEFHVLLTPGMTSQLVVENVKKPNLLIIKTDAVTGERVAGVTFQVNKADGETLGTFTSDENGEVFLEALDPGVYQIRETSVPYGYILNENPQLVTLQPNRTGVVQFQNYPKPTITIQKLDSITGAPIKGAKFQIWYASNNDFLGSGEVNDLGIFYSDEDGKIEIENLRDGWYRVTELEPAPGYSIKDPATQEFFVTAGTSKIVYFENVPLSAIVIRKVDIDTKEPLAGAKFQLRYLSGTSGTGGTVIGTYYTDSNGTITITGLQAGTYQVEELEPPAGYEITGEAVKTVYVTDNEQAVITVEFQDKAHGGLLIKKIDAVTKEPLGGVEFMVTRSDGSVVGTGNGLYTTDSAGTILIPDVKPGETLVVKETKTVPGYVLDDTAKSIKIEGNQLHVLEFTNQPLGGLLIRKLDSDTREPLAGVEFLVTRSDGTLIGTNNGIFVTDSLGTVLITDISPGETIIVKEVKTKEGYILDDVAKSIKITSNELHTLEFLNKPLGGLKILKLDEDTRLPIAGVEFEISYMNGERIGTYRTDRHGAIYLNNITGWLTVIETKPANGYQDDGEPHHVEVKEGKTTVLELTNKRGSSILIKKVDAKTGEGIYGVTFLLYDENKNPIGQYVSDQDGYVFIDGELTAGKYFLRELKAAEGYVLDEELKTVYVEPGATIEIRWENQPIYGQIIVTKLSSDFNEVTGKPANTPLAGAVFEITRARSGAVVGYITTDARGVAASEPLPLGRYFLQEVTAPAHYRGSGEKFEADLEYENQIIKLVVYNQSATLGVDVKKVGNQQVAPAELMRYDFQVVANNSNVSLDNFYLHDRIPTDAVRGNTLTTGTYNARLNYRIIYKTNYNDYRVLAENLLSTNTYSFSLNANVMGLMQGEYVTDVRFEYGTVPAGFKAITMPMLTVNVLGTVPNGYQIVNRAEVGGQSQGTWETALSSWITIVNGPTTPPATLPQTGY